MDAETLAAILAERIAWMRAYVRCETCKWWSGNMPTKRSARLLECLCPVCNYYGLSMMHDDSCSTHWEPVEEATH